METTSKPARGFNFRLEVDDVTQAAFEECLGLPADDDGDDVPLADGKFADPRKFTVITLKRGYTASPDLWNWYQTVVNGVTGRRDGSIILGDEEGQEVQRWVFVEGWISKWEGPALKSGCNDVAIESIEISHEGIELG